TTSAWVSEAGGAGLIALATNALGELSRAVLRHGAHLTAPGRRSAASSTRPPPLRKRGGGGSASASGRAGCRGRTLWRAPRWSKSERTTDHGTPSIAALNGISTARASGLVAGLRISSWSALTAAGSAERVS